MITQKDVDAILDALAQVDVKKMEIDHPDPQVVKWFRFGSFSGMQIAAEIVKQMKREKKTPKS